MAVGRSVVSEFTIYGQRQAERELQPLPCLCDQVVHNRGASLSHSFGSVALSKRPADAMAHELSKSLF